MVEGLKVLDQINDLYLDKNNRPFLNCRILNSLILEDPFEDKNDIELDSPKIIYFKDGYLELDEYKKLEREDNKIIEKQIEENLQKYNLETKKVVLEMINVLPSHDVKPPDNIIFVCQLNKRTLEEDLEIIFSQFGKIKKCDLVRDWKTGESLQYAFIEYETKRAAEEAYFKMQNCLIDNKRIHVDFSQSTNKMWNNYNGYRKRKRDFFREIRGVDKNKIEQPQINIKLKNRYKKNYQNDLLFDKKKSIKKLKKFKRSKNKRIESDSSFLSSN